MTERKRTPDILSDLLGSAQPSPLRPHPSTLEQQDGTPEYQQDSKMSGQQDGAQGAKEDLGRDETNVDEPKVKATFYLSKSVVEALEDAHLALRRMAGAPRRSGVSKSLIVEKALELALEELALEASQSRLARKITPGNHEETVG